MNLKQPKSTNDNAKELISETVFTIYNDVLQRDPSVEESGLAITTSLLTPQGILQSYKKLLCSPEFLTRFVLPMSPMLIVRIMINQIAGRTPHSEVEIGNLAGSMIASGWFSFVDKFINQPFVTQRILSEAQLRANKKNNI